MLNNGTYDGERILSRASVETMTTDQLTPEQKRISGLMPGDFANKGWGFGVSVVTHRDAVSSVPGRYGWDGGLGTSWSNAPSEQVVTVLMTNKLWDDSGGPPVYHDFLTLAYAAIDD
jgi:CubicO group peptidase (beta-lactamase class C family)